MGDDFSWYWLPFCQEGLSRFFELWGKFRLGADILGPFMAMLVAAPAPRVLFRLSMPSLVVNSVWALPVGEPLVEWEVVMLW